MAKKRPVCGVGINDADYTVKWIETVIDGDGTRKIKHKSCKIYETWKDMIYRCFSKRYKDKHKTYNDVICCSSWLKFSNFKSWMEQQDWKGKELDKDILVEGNKIYSPSTCVFIDHSINKLILENPHRNSPWLTGVTKYKNGRYTAYGRKYENGKNKTLYLGTFDSEVEAHRCWLRYKINQVENLKDVICNDQVYTALLSRYLARLAIVE